MAFPKMNSEFVKMASCTAGGAIILGVGTQLDLRNEWGLISGFGANLAHMTGQYTDVSKDVLAEVIQEVFAKSVNKISLVNGAVGAFTGNVLYKWIWDGSTPR